MRTIAILISLLTAMIAARDAGAEDRPDWPRTCRAAITKIVDAMSPSDKAELRKEKREDLIQYHFGWGMGIRNEFGLWGGNRALARDCARMARTKGPERLHPDTISMVIIEGVWDALQPK